MPKSYINQVEEELDNCTFLNPDNSVVDEYVIDQFKSFLRKSLAGQAEQAVKEERGRIYDYLNEYLRKSWFVDKQMEIVCKIIYNTLVKK
jgi:hypothetical protein